MFAVFSSGICIGLLAVAGECTLDRAAEVIKRPIEVSSEAVAKGTCAHLAYEKLTNARPGNGDAVAVVWLCELQK
jgi:hypothetical protein